MIHERHLIRRVRWQLVAWSGGSTLVVLLILGTVIYAAVAQLLEATGTAQLDERAQLLQGVGPAPAFLQSGQGEVSVAINPAQPGLVFGGPSSGTLALVIPPGEPAVGDRTEPLPVSSPGMAAPLPVRATGTAGLLVGSIDPDGVAAARDGERSVRNLVVDGTPVRVLSKPIDLPDGRYVVQVVGDRTAEERTLASLATILVVGGFVVLVLSLVVGSVYAGRALIPIRDSLRRQRDFAADASHELRTPLAIIRANVEHLRRTSRDAVAAASMDAIDAETTRLTTLVDDLLLLARADSGEQEIARVPLDLSEVALEAVPRLSALADRNGVRIELDVAPTPIEGDPERLRQLVAILLDNAVRHSPSGGTVHVSVGSSGSRARLEVADEGPGVRPEHRQRIFDRFWRAPDAPPGGTGLGLAIAAWIADRHGGAIELAEPEPTGARFVVTLPQTSTI